MIEFIKKLTQKQIRLIILGMIIVLSLIVLEEIVDDIFSDPLIGDTETLIFDNNVLKSLREYRSPDLNQSMVDITALGSFSVITLLTCILTIFLLAHKDWRGLLYIFTMAAGTLVIPVMLKSYFLRDRPDPLSQIAYAQHSSFPSGHSFGATVAYFSMAFLLTRELKELKLEFLYYFLAIVVVMLVGVSRMYLGVHYPTDVIGGISSGLIWFSLVSMVFIYFSKGYKAR